MTPRAGGRRAATAVVAASLACAVLAAPLDSPVAREAPRRVTEAEARRILESPLEATAGGEEATRVRRVAVANGLLRHCGMTWERLFEALTRHHRAGLRRPQAEMARIVVWHGGWQGAAMRIFAEGRPSCDVALRRRAAELAEAEWRLLVPSPPSGGGAGRAPRSYGGGGRAGCASPPLAGRGGGRRPWTAGETCVAPPPPPTPARGGGLLSLGRARSRRARGAN